MTDRSPTLKDVAERAGVSLKTTSRVLNGEKCVRPQTEQRVRLAMAELGFRPNYFARRLRLGADSSAIGVVVEDLSDPAHAAMAHAIEQRAHERAMLVVVASSRWDEDRERQLVAAMCHRPVSGLIVVPTGADHDHLTAEQERGLPVVSLGRPANGLCADTVLADHGGAAALAVAHLRRHGHRRIAYLGEDRQLHSERQRLDGYAAALGADPRLVRGGLPDQVAAGHATRELLAAESADESATALLTANDQLTIGAFRALRELGRPDVAVVGLGDFLAADLLGVTVVRHDPAELGRLAADRLLARLDGDRGTPTMTTVAVQLVVRGSGEMAP